jgi:hypothetical protein
MFCQLYQEKRNQCSATVKDALNLFLLPEIVSEIIAYAILDKHCFLYETLNGVYCSRIWGGWMLYLNADSKGWILSLITSGREVHWNCAIDLNEISMDNLVRQSKDFPNYLPPDKTDKLLDSLQNNLERNLNKASIL